MDCRLARSLLDAYLDNELDRADARAFEAHVDGCASCRGALSESDELRRALHEASLRYPAPPALHERIVAAIATPTPAQPQHAWRPAPTWMRYAAACVIAFGAGGLSLQWWHSTHDASVQAQLASDLFASHWRALAATSPVDVVSSDHHTVKPWFAGKVAQSPEVRDFSGQGFALVGGRIDYVGSERVPVLVYRHGQHLIDVFVLSRTGATRVGPAQQQGYALQAITLDGQPAAIVTDMDPQEVTRFAQLLSH
ncbi:anti-sigma factor family protein [Solilutibacter silvestris]|uniref:Putative zinc-finger n=1 Tax=Solilutibacter silvestris TaxID=1645665 RepID=A0A2K1PX83_9GAMM|nr:zf-HC2 domain-containing protein [Lysobacter silvestris]PNS07405.1 putative zinc-finger [Lysobacter silvestris]